MSRFLITTADERTWPRDQAVLFLGEWCRLYDRESTWKELGAEVVPYHWDNRENLHRDYQYLQTLYEELLQELSAQLNVLHGVSHSQRYWRILLGPWLGYFTGMIFDRWEMIQRAVTEYSVIGVRVLEIAPEQMVPNDMVHFERLFVSDAWNEMIYSQLLRGWTEVPIEIVQSADTPSPLPPLRVRLSPARRLKRKLGRTASIISQWFVRENEAFFLSSCLPIKQDLLLQWRLKQVPKFWRPLPAPRAEVDWDKRQWQLGRSEMDGFPAIVRAMIPRHLPVLYLEGYAALVTFCRDLPWPKKPHLIFTSNSYSSDEVFKAWAAEKIEAGAKFVVGQHGGNYGTGRWESTEDHQRTISDFWLSWGWGDPCDSKITPVGNLKLFGCESSWDCTGGALMVESCVPRYSYRMYSVPVASQWLDYFEEQCRFVAALPVRLRQRLTVRLHHQDYGWCPMQRWRHRFPDIRMDEGVNPIAPLVETSRLYIATYNATTFLESLAMNIPTIMFWNPKHWELRDSAMPCFGQLKSVGIFHETPESAAQQMAHVWDDVATWWGSEPLQTVREQFCHRYSRMPEHPLEIIEQVLSQVARQPITTH